MSRLLTVVAGLMLTVSAFAQELPQGFSSRFTLVRNAEGKVTAIKLKKVVSHFTIKPFIEQIKSDLMLEQKNFFNLTDSQMEAEIDDMLYGMGLDPYMKANGSDEAQKIKESLLNIPNINVDNTFSKLLAQKDFWQEFETKLNEAFLFIDPTVLANLEDARFFYKRQVTYRVVVWALEQARKRFSNIPVLNIASYVIVRVHDMMMEQRHFHHNMLLHYFETLPESKLGMTKEEVDRTVSSIYEYRIDTMDIISSNAAARDWLNFGFNRFYQEVRSGNTRIRTWEGPMTNVRFENIKKIDFAFAEVTESSARKIYHLHHTAHQFSKRPALAYDYSSPNRVKRNRALLNLAGVALGFIQMPGWLKSNVDNFIESFYVKQVRTEGALAAHFELTGNTNMLNRVYAQRANFYIVQ